ncbi:Protein NRT1/ PTR FAMILY 5.8 [Ananas comosus]|uniref:Protein NRT1/ PTR FAMILY 5.8 n=1 Tax=Ananas comosus TaxID=4615 RepID=A0A199VRB4_ANACO|nr:Protein NRT1/ PTR FAMILY 5.8 [Ananas comosus]
MALEKRTTGLSKSCILIIVVASVERFAYKGVASNLVTYLTDVVKMSMSSAAKCVSTWSGVTSMLPLITAILVDSYWDRYSTIMASALLYVVGLVSLTSWALLHAWMPCTSLFLPLYLISIGQGGYNPSLQAFGADQLEIEDDSHCSQGDDKSKVKSLFFQWWYFGICSGSLLGNSLMPYIQDSFSWALGFAIPSGMMSLSVASFLCGTRFYVHKQAKIHNRPQESIIQVIKTFAAKILNRKFRLPSRDDDDDVLELELQEKPLKDDFNGPEGLDRDLAKLDEPPRITKTILRLFPIWMMLLMFAVIFQQPITFFTKQGMMMNHRIGSSFVVPPAMLQSAITISIILIMPLYDKLIIPFGRLLTRDEKGISVLQRIGIGMFLSTIAMVIAALVELKRVGVVRKEGPLESEKQMSIFWLLPQYIILGISDVFTVVGMQEFFYTEVPSTMRTIGIALYLSVFGVGSFLSSFLISFVEMINGKFGKNNSWFSDDPREARLYNYYWFLALLSSISFLIFAKLSRHYNTLNSSAK